MTLRVVGAGLGRTGTHSLKLALEQLLGGPCYHMVEVFGRPDDIAVWQDAVDDEPVDWNALMHGYAASVDWPACGVLARARRREPRRDRAAVDPLEPGRVVEERERDDLRGRAPRRAARPGRCRRRCR